MVINFGVGIPPYAFSNKSKYSRFFLSLDDPLFRIFGGDKIKTILKQFQLTEDGPFEATLLTKALSSAQEKVESFYYDTRKRLFDYDEILNKLLKFKEDLKKKVLNDSVK